MKLRQLLGAEDCQSEVTIDTADFIDVSQIDISGLAMDSRRVQKDNLFFAIGGTSLDGFSFICDAVDRGASAVVLDRARVSEARAMVSDDAVVLVGVKNVRLAVSRTASKLYAPQPDCIAAITGTNGKTSVARFLQQFWAAAGKQAGSIGTLGLSSKDGTRPLGLTSPDPLQLHEAVQAMALTGVTHLAVEASSHGLDQYRLDGLNVRVAAFTNLSQDHLDYHASMEDYFHAKCRLFTQLLPRDHFAIVHVDTAYGERVRELCLQSGRRVLPVGGYELANDGLRLLNEVPTDTGHLVHVCFDGVEYEIAFPLFGRFQLDNALVAAGLALATDIGVPDVMGALECLEGVPGRLECIGQSKRGALVFVDYAHTPDALMTILQTLRDHTQRQLHVVFGAGGDRDAGKRAIMGERADYLADRCYITDDNPRSEDPAEIRSSIMSCMDGAVEIPDRAEAIHHAVSNLAEGDVLVIAGKGHETGQHIGSKILPFDDRAVARQALLEHGGQCD